MNIAKGQVENRNTWLLWLCVIITLIFVWRLRDDDTTSQAILPTKILAPTVVANQAQQSQLINAAQFYDLKTRKSFESRADLFAIAIQKIAYVAPNRQPKAQAVIVPPLPFQYIGRWQDQTQLLVLLSMNDEIVTAKEGDIIFNQYKVLRIIDNTQGLSVTFLNQPYHQTQVLQVGKAQDE